MDQPEHEGDDPETPRDDGVDVVDRGDHDGGGDSGFVNRDGNSMMPKAAIDKVTEWARVKAVTTLAMPQKRSSEIVHGQPFVLRAGQHGGQQQT